MKSKLFALIFVCWSGLSNADARTEKVRELMDAQGMLDMWTQKIDLSKQQNAKYGQQMLDQMFSQMNPDEKFKGRFKAAFNKFMSSLEDRWTPAEMVDVWAKYYGAGFTDAELDQLVSFYTSPLGQKDVRVSKEASISFSKYFQDAMQPIMESATAQYIKDLKLIAMECKCAK